MKTRRLPPRIGLATLLAVALLWSATLLAAAAPTGPDPSSDTTPPTVLLVKPADNHWQGATFVTGQDFLLVGTAEDQGGVKAAWFELCSEDAEVCLKDWDATPGDDSWRAIGDVPALETPDIPGQYQAEWDSTEVLDGFYFIRICAEDNAGNSNCMDSRADLPLIDGDEHLNPYLDAHWVYVNNRVEIPLQVGWNLISTPLALYDSDIGDVLAHLIAHGTVESVWTMVWEGDPLKQVWKVWTPAPGPVDTLTKIVDGQGYWIKMKANDTLTVVGTWATLGIGPPPEWKCPAADTWHLIGYTHRGRPTILAADTVEEYLAGLLDGCWWLRLGSLFYYDPWTNVWAKLYEPHNMVVGKGYWLYVAELPPIRP